MKKTLSIMRAALLFLGAGLFLQGCFFEDDCYNRSYTTCVTMCDAFWCWDECTVQNHCVSKSYGYDYCVYDKDCGRGNYCLDGRCHDRRNVISGTVPMCGACTDSRQCSEVDGLCTLINQATNETVCTRPCNFQSDCPHNFVCENVGPGVSPQCIPKTNSCGNVSQYCDNITLCSHGQVCSNNLCVRQNTVECYHNEDCGDPYEYVCHNNMCSRYCFDDYECAHGDACYYTAKEFFSSGICMQNNYEQCRYSTDCFDNSFACVNARCEKSCSRDRDCNNSYTDDYRCVQGFCRILGY